MPSLIVARSGETPRRVDLVHGCCGIGRHPANDVVLSDESASRWHAAIFAEPDGRFRLRDLSSRRATRMAGRRIVSRILDHGATFAIGPYELTFRERGEGDEQPRVVVADDAIPAAAMRDVTPSRSSLASGVLASVSPLALIESLWSIAATLDVEDLLQAMVLHAGASGSPSVCLAALVRDDSSLDVRAVRSELEGPHHVSRSVVQRALDAGRPALLHPDLQPDDGTQSMRTLGISAALAAPLSVAGVPRALLYADWRAGAPPPDPTQLEWIASLALHAAAALENALHHARLRDERDQIAEGAGSATQLVGTSRSTRELLDLVDRCAAADVDALVWGETGTGKELVARRIHERSGRRAHPFVAVNCAAIPPDLFESELFGHARGSFTHAIAARAGKFMEADGGTLFLDEIAEMPPAQQAKLLRVVEDRVVTPVGGPPAPVDVRVIAATNRDVATAVRDGLLRPDLHRRLGVPVRTTPLRERKEDIPLLAHYLLDRLTPSRASPLAIAAATMERLLEHDWPGNVREMAACLRNAVLFCGDAVEPKDLRLTPEVAAPQHAALPTLEEVEREHLVAVLRSTRGNQSKAARVLGLDEGTVRAKMERHGLERESFKQAGRRRDRAHPRAPSRSIRPRGGGVASRARSVPALRQPRGRPGLGRRPRYRRRRRAACCTVTTSTSSARSRWTTR